MSATLPASGPRVCSITVAFNPNAERLAEQIRALRDQVHDIVVVDNGSTRPIEQIPEITALDVKILSLGENNGVASGFNVGVAEARASGANLVLLLDDDSIPAPGMVEKLVQAYRECAAREGGPRVAAVGPRINDPRDPHEYPFIRMGWTHNQHVRCGSEGGVIACDFLISSGSLIPLEALRSLGEFDEELFIDSVDLEWCCRARDRGWMLYGVCSAQLDHRLGDRRQTVLHMELVVHPPERLYYMTRNRFLLYWRPYMPLKWKLKDLLRVLAKFAATMLLIAPRREYARMTLWAIRDALARRGGKLNRGGA